MPRKFYNNRNFLVALSFLLVVVLAAVIFGVEYTSATSEAEKNNSTKNSVIKSLESEKKALESKNAENEAKISNQQKEIDGLNSKINVLESEISSIKQIGQNITSSKNDVSSEANKKEDNDNKKPDDKKPADEKIDVSNLNAPNKGGKVCYLTFDDGPSDNTLKILNVLKEANAKATFFVISTSNLSYVERIHKEGHTVALHANNHEYSKIYKSEKAYFNDLNAIAAKVKKITGVDSKIIRFPGGSSNTASKNHNKGIMTRLTKKVQDKGYVYVDWNVDSSDATGNNVSKKKILNSIKSGAKGRGDICVLMHDSSAKKTTVEALPEIISYLRAQGYRFEALTTSSPVFHHGVNN